MKDLRIARWWTVDILSGSRHAFRSKQIAEARRLLETLLV